jgi:hypothetical protein
VSRRCQSANRHNAIYLVRSGRRCRPHRHPHELYADQAYDAKARRQDCRARRIVLRIARKGIESSEMLGRHWLVVERARAGLNRFRRAPIRYEPRIDIYEAFTFIAARLINLNQIKRLFLTLLRCRLGLIERITRSRAEIVDCKIDDPRLSTQFSDYDHAVIWVKSKSRIFYVYEFVQRLAEG